MNIVVLGADGQLGHSLKKIFEYKGDAQLTYLDIDQLDVCDSFDKNLSKLMPLKPETIINCAAYTQVDKAESEERRAMEINGHSLRNLSLICNELNAKLVHISTDFVFSGEKNTPYNEDDHCKPLSVYGETKLVGENMVREHANSYAIFRTSWLYSNSHPSFYTTMLKLGKERDQLSIVCDQIGTPTSADSLAAAINHYIRNSPKDEKKLYHFSDQGTCSWYDFAHMIFKLNKINMVITPIPSVKYPTPATRPKYSVMSKELFCEELNYTIDHWVDSLEKVAKKC